MIYQKKFSHQLAKLSIIAERQFYRPNQFIFRQGSEGNGLYMILHGKCNRMSSNDSASTLG